jgi:hypothetical protein
MRLLPSIWLLLVSSVLLAVLSAAADARAPERRTVM